VARKQLAALAALICITTPCAASDLDQPSPGMTFYFSLPLDADKRKEQAPAFGLSFQGHHQYQSVNLDSRMFNFVGTGIEPKLIIAGVVAAGATVAVVSEDKKTKRRYEEQRQQEMSSADCPPPSSLSTASRRKKCQGAG
jgi:hypothetical protein